MGSSKTMFGVMGSCALMVAMMMMMMMAGGVAGQGPAPGPAPADCSSVVLNLVDCLGYISGTTETPPAACCSNLSAIIDNTPQCLCQLYNTTLTASLGINVTRAQQLPPACKLTTPDPSLCSAIGIPAAAPGATPISPGPAANAPSSSSTPSAKTPSTPGTTTPTTTAPPPPNGNNAPSVAVRSFEVASSMLFAFILIFH